MCSNWKSNNSSNNSYGNFQFEDDPNQDNIYVNVTMTNNTTEQIVAVANVTKTIPILNKCSDYYASVLRFDIPLNATPLFIMPIVPNQSNPNLTPFIIGMNGETTDVIDETHLIYYPNNSFETIPSQTLLNQQVITPYYYCYNYQVLINMINIGLKSLIDTSPKFTYVKPLITINDVVYYPFFFFDPVSQLLSFFVPEYFVLNPASPEIYINTYLQTYLSSFVLLYNSENTTEYNSMTHTTTVYNDDYYFQTLPSNYQPLLPQNAIIYQYGTGYFNGELPPDPPTSGPTTTPLFFKFTEEYPSVYLWATLRKIIITTNSIPVANEIIPSGSSNTAGQSVSFPILTDFVIPAEQAGQSRSIAFYFPTSQYRLSDMLSDIPLFRIDLRVVWEDTNGNFYDLYLLPLQQASVKLGFFKKSLYKNLLKKM